MRVYTTLRGRFGFQNWWPGDTADEILVGAVLTQQTSWKNVERALANLKDTGMLSVEKLAVADLKMLERLVKPCGFYRQKAVRIRNISSYILANHKGMTGLLRRRAGALRRELLSLDGVGEETADAVALYAGNKRTFVVDAYTRRIVGRLYGIDTGISYGKMQCLITDNIDNRLAVYKDLHAQFVELGKRFCRTRPLCRTCPLNEGCGSFKLLSER